MRKVINEAFVRSSVPLSLALFYLFILVFVFFPQANKFDNWLNPVRKEWTVTYATIDGEDLVLYGTMKKIRECSFQPPPRVHDAFGNHYLVDINRPVPQPLWKSGDRSQNWGPWRVINGANKDLEFFIIDRCHFLWDNSTVLGKYKDASNKAGREQ